MSYMNYFSRMENIFYLCPHSCQLRSGDLFDDFEILTLLFHSRLSKRFKLNHYSTKNMCFSEICLNIKNCNLTPKLRQNWCHISIRLEKGELKAI